jgi:hypothetical protein
MVRVVDSEISQEERLRGHHRPIAKVHFLTRSSDTVSFIITSGLDVARQFRYNFLLQCQYMDWQALSSTERMITVVRGGKSCKIQVGIRSSSWMCHRSSREPMALP